MLGNGLNIMTCIGKEKDKSKTTIIHKIVFNLKIFNFIIILNHRLKYYL